MSEANDTTESTEVEQLSKHDYPEPQPSGEYTVTKDTRDGDLDITITYDHGGIRVSTSGAYEITRTRATLDHRAGKPILSCGRVRLNGERVNLDIGIPEDIHNELNELQDEYSEWLDNAEEWVQNQPLQYHVVEHEYKTGTHRTKYHRSATVLKPNKREHDMTLSERRTYEALQDVLDTADDYPELSEDTEYSVGDVLTLDDVADKTVEETVDEIAEQEREDEQWQELVAEYPVLRDFPTNTDEVEGAFETAAETGEHEQIASVTRQCNEPSYECNLDKETAYATPDGDIETTRTHTH